MIFQLVKKHEISIIIFLGLLCFVVSLCFYGNQLPGKKIILSEFLSPDKLRIQRNVILFQSDIKYRITSFYESRGTNNFRPGLQLKIEQSDNSILINDFLNTNSGNGGRDGNICWGHNNYGLFSVPSTGEFKLTIRADDYPKEFIILKIFISENASNFGRNSFVIAGLTMFLILFMRKGKRRGGQSLGLQKK